MHLGDFPALDTSASNIQFAPLTELPAFTMTDSGGGSSWTIPSVSAPVIPTLPTITVPFTPTVQSNIPTLPLTTVTYTPTIAPTPSVPAPSPTPQVTQQATPPQQSSGDWFSKYVQPLLTTGIQAYAISQQRGTVLPTSALPAGVSPSYIIPRSNVQTLTPSQIATLTPAQQQAYYASLSNPSLYPSTGNASILSTLGLGSMDPTTLLMIGGGVLMLILMMRKG